MTSQACYMVIPIIPIIPHARQIRMITLTMRVWGLANTDVLDLSLPVVRDW